MKIVSMKITAKISLATNVTPFVEDKTFEAISVYQLDDQDKLVCENALATETEEVSKLLKDGIIQDQDVQNAAIRPKTISSVLGELNSTLIAAFNNNNCKPGGSLKIEKDSKIVTVNLNNQRDCYAALKMLKIIIPSKVAASKPVYTQFMRAVILPIAPQNHTWITNAYNMAKENGVPFLLGAVATGVAVALRNNMS